MPAPDERYCIKEGYRPNAVAATYDAAGDTSYWDAGRIATASEYQYDAYRIAAGIVRDFGIDAVLDVGSGPPKKLAELMPAGLRIHLVDQPSTRNVAASLLPGAAFTGADLEHINLDLGESFGMVLCADVIEHLLDPDPCLAFMRRHLRPGGLLLLTTPERDVLRGPSCDHIPHPMHVREWNRDEFRAFLESRGLEVVGQRLLPQRRVRALRRMGGRLLDMLGRPPSWYSCQLALCRSR